MHIVVLIKAVPDPDSITSLKVGGRLSASPDGRGLATTEVPFITNGFDEQAIEAALQIRETSATAPTREYIGGMVAAPSAPPTKSTENSDGKVTLVSIGGPEADEVLKHGVAMGANDAIRITDELNMRDGYATAYLLSKAIQKIGQYDLVLGGRQASDSDYGGVMSALSEHLGIPNVNLAQTITVDKEKGVVNVERVTGNGYDLMETSLPTLVSVTNEIGPPRYPTLRGVMAARRATITQWTLEDLGLDPADQSLRPKVVQVSLEIPYPSIECEMVEGDTDEEKGQNLALLLREHHLI